MLSLSVYVYLYARHTAFDVCPSISIHLTLSVMSVFVHRAHCVIFTNWNSIINLINIL